MGNKWISDTFSVYIAAKKQLLPFSDKAAFC